MINNYKKDKKEKKKRFRKKYPEKKKTKHFAQKTGVPFPPFFFILF